VFGAIFGGERFVPIIGTISLAKDMKSALQEAEDGEEADENSGQPRLKDAKGRDILTPEEKTKNEEKDRIKAEKEKQKAAEVSFIFMSMVHLVLKKYRKPLHELNALINWWKTLSENLGFSRSPQLARMTPTFRVVGGRYPS